MREVHRRYEDPLDRIWTEAARRIGLTVARTPDAFATTDGRGALLLGDESSLDADDCLAQMIFHELCHSLVQGPDSFELPDWGLENTDPRDLAREHACLRAQAFLAARLGLREVLAPTTDHRAFFDQLPEDPLAADDESVEMARLAIGRADRSPWSPHLEDALRATAVVVHAAAPFASEGSLLFDAAPERPVHPAGGYRHATEPGRCGECAWLVEGACTSTRVLVDEAWPACERFERSLDCRACGACCREGFDVVELAADDPFVAAHGALVERIDGRLVLRRLDGRCPPLRGDGRGEPFACAVYEDRPQTCRDLAPGSDGCLTARRRVGRSL
ncbi:MAG: YkgJ family cysteine cluster protein [Myxococcales bacterium]|nr:YkgJ family cysteine cluster protein [Myxococcales bacterium]